LEENPVNNYTVLNDSTITAVLSNCTSGKVFVTTPNGTDSMYGFKYIPPIITSFSPTIACSGATINIKGKNFTGTTSVTFGGVNAASFKVNSDTSISAVVDSSATGRIAVTTPIATGTSGNIFSLGSKTTAYAYIANNYYNTVSVINTENDSVVATIPVGQRPYSVCAGIDGVNVYVANGDSTISIINTEIDTVIKSLAVGFNPYSLNASRNGKEIYVTNAVGGSIGIINTETNSLDPLVNFNNGYYENGYSVNVSPDDREYVVSGMQYSPQAIMVLRTPIDSIPTIVQNIGNPVSLCTSPDESLVYVTNNCSYNNYCNTVGVINTALDTATRFIPVGNGPSGICVSPDGNRVYVANNIDNTVSVVNAVTDTVIATIGVGYSPLGISITPDGKKVYVANQNSNTVSVISTASNKLITTIFVGGSPISLGNFIANVVTPCGALPVKVLDLSAKNVNNTNLLQWHTAVELNTSHFIIRHSTTGTSFTDIGTVKAIGSGANGYSFTDYNPANGINYYRLESVDKDGSSTYSKVVSAQFTVNSNQLTVYPNPAKEAVTIKGNHIVSVQVIDNMGRVVKVVSLKDATNPTLSVNSLAAGVYHLRIQTMDGNVSGVGFVKE